MRTMEHITEEITEKERRVREMAEREGVDAVALSTIGNFAWLTCGGNNYVGIAAEVGAATAVITRDAKYIVADNIEAPRIRDEEVEGQGFEVRHCPWHDGSKDDLIRDIAGGGVIGSDVPMEGAKNIAAELDRCRASLTRQEIERYRWLGKNTGQCLSETCQTVEPGMTEHEIGADLNARLLRRGITPVVNLVAVDDRIEKYRHPLPTDRKLERYAMIVTCARKWGLILSTTRLVHFGPLPEELKRKHEAVVRVDAAFISGTTVGAHIGEIFRHAQQVYAETGFADEWKLHHQGGPTGYKGREFRANASTDAVVVENQPFAWNPSITGTKSEDTIIASAQGTEILSMVDDWPSINLEINGQMIPRAGILVR